MPELDRPGAEPVLCAIVLEGLLARDVRLAGRTATQLIGPGEPFDPWAPADDLLPSEVGWSVLEPAVVAVLDARFAAACRRWPMLGWVVQRRLSERADRLASLTATLQLQTVERRVLGVMWHLAERFGRMSPDGVVLPLRLTHQLIGRLVGAERPSVTLALGQLVTTGQIVRREDGAWLLDAGSRQLLVPN
jgi:CRP-like cAMP-binding protein